MLKYRKKPVIIEAIQFVFPYDKTTDKGPPYPYCLGELFEEFQVWYDELGPFLLISTLEGTHRANLNDWIITGIKGEKYPCKPIIFEATYEKV